MVIVFLFELSKYSASLLGAMNISFFFYTWPQVFIHITPHVPLSNIPSVLKIMSMFTYKNYFENVHFRIELKKKCLGKFPITVGICCGYLFILECLFAPGCLSCVWLVLYTPG